MPEVDKLFILIILGIICWIYHEFLILIGTRRIFWFIFKARVT